MSNHFADAKWWTPATLRSIPLPSTRRSHRSRQAFASLASRDKRLLTIGGDHTIALPILRVMRELYGPVALVHFDAHLDTWDTYFGEPYTHGTPFRRAWEEKLLLPDRAMHVGIRGPLYSPTDLADDASFGFSVVHCHELETLGVTDVVAADTRAGR